jgi:hypothetical protein
MIFGCPISRRGLCAEPAASAAPPVAVCSATRLSGPDPTRLYKYQREIADAISDPDVERITMFKGPGCAPAHHGKACY